MNIVKNSNSFTHNTRYRSCGVSYIVIHYTATDGATGANEVVYFSRKTTKKASADFFVDFDGTVYQYNNDPAHRYSRAVGGKKLSTGGGSMHGKITNSNSISIEMCCRKVNGVWKITDETYNATIELAKSLKVQFGLPSGRAYRHYDVTGKLCPNVEGFISPDTRWQSMRAAIDGTTTETQSQVVEQPKNNQINRTHRFSLSVDGSLGPASVRALQSWLGTPMDGVVSGQPYSNKKYLPACQSNWHFTSHGASGSMMIKRLQGVVGAKADGYCGKGTVTALQMYLRNKGYNISVDGSLGPGTAKALQQYLNTL